MSGDNQKPANGELLADFWARLDGDGCDRRHIQEMITRIKNEQAIAMADAARLFFRTDSHEPISLLQIADELDELRCRAEALELAIIGGRREAKINGCGAALEQQAGELLRGLERLQAAVSAEVRLSIDE